MTMLISVALSAALLTSVPAPPGEDGLADLTQAQAFTIVANVLGAATACNGIAHDHVSAVARRIGVVATSRMVSAEEVAAIERVLITSAIAGRQAVTEGMTDCETVEAAFSNIEQTVMQTPV